MMWRLLFPLFYIGIFRAWYIRRLRWSPELENDCMVAVLFNWPLPPNAAVSISTLAMDRRIRVGVDGYDVPYSGGGDAQ